MTKSALIVGNSDGIGLALTQRLLKQGWRVVGLSRSASPLEQTPQHVHHQVDVDGKEYEEVLEQSIAEHIPDLCVYCVGIGEMLNLDNADASLTTETKVLRVNLISLAKTVAVIIPPMLKRGSGHLIGLSSLGDELHSPDAPSYSASKAGFSSYLESLGLALRPRGIAITNVRFGFVDTKMAKSPVKPQMMTAEKAAHYLERCIANRPLRFSRPRLMGLLTRILRILTRWKIWFRS